MKFRCERDTLADAIAVAQRAVASRTGALPVLSRFAGVAHRGGRRARRVRPRVDYSGGGTGGHGGRGSRVVPARLFSEIVHKLDPGTVTVEFTDDEARVEAGRFRTALRTLSAADFLV